MKAIVCTRYGTAQGLQLTELDRPSPRDDQVLIRIHATTVTSGDVVLRQLKLPLRLVFSLFYGLGKNAVLGHELAGEVESVGAKVERFGVGEPVFASTGNRGGAYAEYICLPEDGMLASKPENMSYAQAAAVPIGANTALHLLMSRGVERGDEVLIYGASGSVGTYALQLACYYGAHVTGVCSTANLELVRSLGAEQVIDYTQEDFTRRGRTYDLIFDAVGKITASHCKGSLKEDGAYLSVKSPTREKSENLVFLKELIEAGKIRAVIDRCYPLEEMAAAHSYVEKGHKRGNVVINVVPDRDPTLRYQDQG